MRAALPLLLLARVGGAPDRSPLAPDTLLPAPLQLDAASDKDGVFVGTSVLCRRCAGIRPSVISVSGQNRAGLRDKTVVLRALGNLAGSLCARLHISPPA